MGLFSSKFHIYVKPVGQAVATKVSDTQETRKGFATKAEAEKYARATGRTGSEYKIR